jgi:hypothetical protein
MAAIILTHQRELVEVPDTLEGTVLQILEAPVKVGLLLLAESIQAL